MQQFQNQQQPLQTNNSFQQEQPPFMSQNFDQQTFNSQIQQPPIDHIFIKIPTFQTIKKELRWSVQVLNAYKLYNSAKWAGELLQSVTKPSFIKISPVIKSFIEKNTDTSYQFEKEYTENVSEDCADALMIARNLFDLKEYKKCAHVLKSFIDTRENQPAIFLHYYSLYLSGEIRKEEEIFENCQNSKAANNPELKQIGRGLEKLFTEGSLDELNQYLYGLVLKQQQQLKNAKMIFINVLNQFPCFWSAWLELNSLIQGDDIEEIFMQLTNDHWMKNFFFSSFCLEKYRNILSIEINHNLLCFFKNSTYLMNQIAHSFYNSQDFEISLEWFEKLVDIDPFRYENMDTYSNILYIKENQGELSNLALRCFYNNKYAPETCCVVGNYYSLMGDHLKAVIYFRKALKLDRNCLAAWTLMGHEHLEMKNIAGAIEAYRNAVEIDPKDFRAWYGLGQTYELQNQNHYALYYFARAVMSRPKDSRMHNAMGQCYDKMDKKNEAMKCYERAENGKDKEGLALHQLAKLYDIIGYEEKAFQCFDQNLKRKDAENLVDKELGECLIYLAIYYKKYKNYQMAQQYATRLLDFSGSERDEANSIIQEINNLQQNALTQSNLSLLNQQQQQQQQQQQINIQQPFQQNQNQYYSNNSNNMQ